MNGEGYYMTRLLKLWQQSSKLTETTSKIFLPRSVSWSFFQTRSIHLEPGRRGRRLHLTTERQV